MALTEREPLLAAVVIGRNEERWIERCLDSVVTAVASVPDADVVMVDSCSTDATVARATRQPVRVVELRPDAPLSPALGRRVGQALTRSRYVLFVDGDTEIAGAWVREALAYLEAHPTVAGVDGKLPERHYDGERPVGGAPDIFGAGHGVAEVEGLGGNALYRRAALDAAGSFNPYIVSYEEAELAGRLRRAGFAVVRLPIVMGTHHTGVRGSMQELRRRYRDNLIKGYGQTLRVALGQGTFLQHARAMKRYLQFQAVVACGLLAGLVAAVTGDGRVLAGALVLGATLVALFMVRSRSVTKPFRLLADWSVWTLPMLRGFVERPRDPRLLRIEAVVARERAGERPAERAPLAQGA